MKRLAAAVSTDAITAAVAADPVTRSPRRRLPPQALRAAALGLGVVSALAIAQVASASTTIVTEQFGAGWTPGAEWAISGTYTPQIVGIGGQTPANALRLTPSNQTSKTGAITYTLPQPTRGGLDISFTISQWGTDSQLFGQPPRPGNGMSFFLRKGSDPSDAATAWSGGAGLGYVGLPGGLVGVGFDRLGGFPWTGANGSGCNTGAATYDIAINNISIRGPGQPGTGDVTGTGYCLLTDTSPTWATSGIDFSGADRTQGARAIRVTVDPSTAATPQIKVYYNGSATAALTQGVPAGLLAEPTFKFGFAAGTGAATNNHEVWGLTVTSLETLPPVDITTASLPSGTVGTTYSCTTIAQANGVAPVNFFVASGTLPAGLTLDSATGELCGTPTRSGTYGFTVSARDSRGPAESTDSKAYTVVVADSAPPCTPINLSSQAGVTSARVSWAPDDSEGCGGVASYEVEASNGRTCTVTAPEKTCSIADLLAGEPVRFRVRARNDIGVSAWSEYGAVAVPEAKPSDVDAPEAKRESAVRITSTATTTLTAIVVPVTTTRPGLITVIGSSREAGRWVTRCIGRTRADAAGIRRVPCVLAPVARRVLCKRALRVRLLVRIAGEGRPVDTARRYTIVAKRNCVPRVTG